MNYFQKLALIILNHIHESFSQMWFDFSKTRIYCFGIDFLPVWILLFNLIFHLLITINIASLNYDEFILLSISKQPTHEFFNTIQAEPHPLGFYLLLRLFQLTHFSTSQIRIILTAFFHSVLLFTTIFAYKSKLIEKFNAKLGLSLVFTSFVIFQVGIQVKQDVVSFPLFFVFFVSSFCLAFLKTRHPQVLKSVSFFSVTLLLFFSYIYLLFSSITILLFLVFAMKKKAANGTFFFCTLIVLTISSLFYFYAYGHYQIENNYLQKNRFLWTQTVPNSFIAGIPGSIAGAQLDGPIGDAFTIIFIVLFFTAIKQNRKSSETAHRWVLAAFLIFLLTTSFSRLFVQDRYSVPVFMVFMFICGSVVGIKLRQSLIWILLFVLYIRSATVILSASDNTRSFETLARVLSEVSQNQKTGLLSNLPGGGLYLKVRFAPKLPQIIPLSTSKNSALIPKPIFNRQYLSESAESIEKTSSDLQADFRSLQFSQFVLVDSYSSAYSFYDPEHRTKSALASMCTKNDELVQFNSVDVVLFSDCQ